MGFWSSLFGGSKGAASGPARSLGEEEYKGFTIRAVAMAAGSEHQLAGEISKDIAGETRTYKFVRADKFGSAEEAASAALNKGRQLIDEQGEKVFAQSWP